MAPWFYISKVTSGSFNHDSHPLVMFCREGIHFAYSSCSAFHDDAKDRHRKWGGVTNCRSI